MVIEFAPGEPELKRDLYIMIPAWIVDKGLLPLLKLRSLKVLIEIGRRVNFSSRVGNITFNQIHKETGIPVTHINEAIKQLKLYGILKTEYYNKQRVYKLLYKAPDNIVPLVEFFKNDKKEHKDRYIEPKEDIKDYKDTTLIDTITTYTNSVK